MKKIFIIAATLFAASFSFAAKKPAFDLKMNLSLDGKEVASPRVITLAGQKAQIIQGTNDEKTFIEVVAADDQLVDEGKHLIAMSFVVGKIDKNGKRTVLSTPQITAFENETATISVGDKPTKMDMTLSVLATRTSP